MLYTHVKTLIESVTITGHYLLKTNGMYKMKMIPQNIKLVAVDMEELLEALKPVIHIGLLFFIERKMPAVNSLW